MAVTTRYIFVTGGVLSGLGKGITAASLGKLFKARGLTVNIQKCDPYLNVDAGTLNPREHGECFVTKDGAETDLDLGHYERFLDEELTQSSSLMSGRVLLEVIEKERNGGAEGRTVQIIPHVTSAIQRHIEKAGEGFDIHIVEIGGTIGDYESLSFFEAIREMGLRLGPERCAYVHVVYLPYLEASREIKTKPAQNSVRELRGLGIIPNIVVGRSERPAPVSVKTKLGLYSGISPDAVALLPNAKTIYEVPLTLERDGIAARLCEQFHIKAKPAELADWRAVVEKATKKHPKTVRVGIVAKYLDNQDTYMCVFEALRSAGWASDTDVDIIWIDAEKLATEKNIGDVLGAVDGIVVPGGFGGRGVEGKIKAATYALEHELPYLGLCYGLHMAVIAAARRHGLKDANTTEVNPDTKYPVIATMADQKGKENTGGTMRLGNYDCRLTPGSLAAKVYKATDIVERHRHRYECNPKYVPDYQSWGINAVGTNPKTGLVEVIEAINHPFFIASQYHPEFKSRPNRPHPLFDGFIKALIVKDAKVS